MRILAVIPARGGSKGIPRKNMRLIGGSPLISYSINNAVKSAYITDVVVTTDSDEILDYASTYPICTIRRSGYLAEDSVTLDPVVYNAVEIVEKEQGAAFDVVVTLQPTSPLLKVETLDAAIESFLEEGFDTSISAVNRPHLAWTVAADGVTKIPAYKERLNRQQLPPNYLEAGAFVIAKRAFVTENSRIGDSVGVYEISEDEAVDIDTPSDWILSQALLNKKKIAFRLDGYKELGLGHVYRGLTLAYELTGHDIVFVCDKAHRPGIEKVQSCFMPVVEVDGDEDFFEWLDSSRCDVVVVDQLDTSAEYITEIKKRAPRVVSFEDLGPGAYLADATVNALYEDEGLPHTFHCGEKFVCLRDEFCVTPASEFSEKVQNVFVMFGGSDPLNLTERVVRMAQGINSNEVKFHFDVVLGPAYHGADFDERALDEVGVTLHRDLQRVSSLMSRSDIAFTSQGRSVYELCKMAVPSIVIAQNEREQKHSFAEIKNGFINLGLGTKISDHDIKRTFEWLVSASTIRRQMHEVMKEKDLGKGIARVVSLILGGYDE